MHEISGSELYESLIGHGLFTDKLPPIFTSEEFYKYCLSLKCSFEDKWYGYIKFDSVRNSNVPRQLGIPHPFAYERLCKILMDNWNSHILPYFFVTTGHKYKVSTIHLRKMAETKALFQMNYDNYRTDGSPENDLMIGKRYLVKTDISTCFPSMYSHSLPWALVGKDYSKTHKEDSEWFNQIDEKTRNCKCGETHGLLIGPHASNLLSEIILRSVDSRLSKYSFLRHIDDYEMYASDETEAKQFLLDLSSELSKYDLLLNHKKTQIIQLPITKEEDWVRHLNSFNLTTNYGQVDYKLVKSYLDLAVELTVKNNNASALLYAIKVLSGKTLTDNGKKLCAKEAMHFSFIFPYLIPFLKEFVFDLYLDDKRELKDYLNRLYLDCLKQNNFEGAYYCLYYAIEYDLLIDYLEEEIVLNSDNCIIKTVLYIYCKKTKNKTIIKRLIENAKSLNTEADFDSNWLFVYEALPNTCFSGLTKNMKLKKISFIKSKYLY